MELHAAPSPARLSPVVGFALGWLCLLLQACTTTSFYRTHISQTPCELSQPGACAAANLLTSQQQHFMVGFVELDDQGQFYEPRQADAVLQLLHDEAAKPYYVCIFVHGWHHNAQDNDFNVRRFQETLGDIQQRNPDYQVLGIYVGWQGETLRVPWLRSLTFWDRKEVSENVGRHALLEFLLQVENTLNTTGKGNNKLVTVGHSLGASVVFNALQPLFLQRLVQPADGSVRSGYGDLVVLINPAFEAIRFAALREAAQKYSSSYGFRPEQNPLLIVATSEGDSVTKNSFALSQKITALFAQHRSLEQPTSGGVKLSEWELDTTAIGHFAPFITHRLQAQHALSTSNCSASAGWLPTAVQRQQSQQAAHGQAASGAGWRADSALLSTATGMEVQHLENSAAQDPYWVLQVATNVMPNHGFINQQPLWCFIEQALQSAAVPALQATR